MVRGSLSVLNLIKPTDLVALSATPLTGSLVRTGPNSVITTDVKHIQKMEASKSAYVKGPWYATFSLRKGNDTVFSTVHERSHARLRSKVGPGYSSSIMVVSMVLDHHVSHIL